VKKKKLLLLVMLCAACRGKKDPAAFERPPAPVSVETAVARDVPVYADEVGKCVAREVVSIVPQVSGRITEIHFTDGANVKSGDLLFTIDPRPLQAQLDAAEANLSQARAARELARTELARSADLLRSQLVSQSDYDTKKSAAEVNEAQVQQAEASVKTARLNLQYCSIHSPIDGRAGHRLVDLGNVVTANSGSLLTIERLDPIYADFTVTENDLTQVQQHMAHGELKVEVRLPDEPARPLSGTLTFLDNAVQESTGTVALRATVPNREHRLWPGRFVRVRLVLATLRGAVLVPATAPQVSAKGPFVYVVSEDSTAELRPVVPGQAQGTLVVIEKGVKAGERVVVNGQLGVTPGGKVAVVEPHP
jgi:membrane fusion protein, multidrug efflux system